MSEFIKVCRKDEISDPGKIVVEVDEEIVVVFHIDGQFYCISDVCTHDDGPLGEGELSGCTIACPRHGAKFDVRTGEALTMPATEPTPAHDVKVEGEDVYVRLRQ